LSYRYLAPLVRSFKVNFLTYPLQLTFYFYLDDKLNYNYYFISLFLYALTTLPLF